jgi:hypothetical protein
VTEPSETQPLDVDAIEAKAQHWLDSRSPNHQRHPFHLEPDEVLALISRIRELEAALEPFAKWEYAAKALRGESSPFPRT